MMDDLLDRLATVILYGFMGLTGAFVVFAAIAWPVFGIPGPTIAFVVAVAIFGPFSWAVSRYIG